MSRLQERIEKDFRAQQRLATIMFGFERAKMAKVLRKLGDDVLGICAHRLSSIDPLNYLTVHRSGIEDRLHATIRELCDLAGREVADIWQAARQAFAIHGKLTATFVARKAQPPWIPVKVDLNAPELKGSEIYHRVAYQFRNLSAYIMQQINAGLVNEETLSEILGRIRAILKKQKTLGARIAGGRRKEAASNPWRQPYLADVSRQSEGSSYEGWEKIYQLYGKPPVDLTEGTLTLEDVDRYRDLQVQAMDWRHRAYTPDDEELWSRNKILSQLEQDFMSDAVQIAHQGMLGSENMGIQDYTWVVSKPQRECDDCTDRDGLTMTEIEERFGTGPMSASYPAGMPANSPPRLHPFCYCQIFPTLRKDWAADALEQDGIKWGPTDGSTVDPNNQQKLAGFQSMTFAEWMETVGGMTAQ